MKVATWNVNSLRARQDRVLDWLARAEPDVLCMQETKVTDAEFPSLEFQRLGYRVVFSGQKTYNGVAIAARAPLEQVHVGFDDPPVDAEQRLIAARVAGTWVYSCYVPNGRSVESEQFPYKLQWLERLRQTLAARHDPKEPIVVCGDFNVAREARDLYDPVLFEGHTHFHPEERARIEQLLAFGLVDAFRIHEQAAGQYTWWDYRAGMFRRNLGLRIDYLFVSAPLAERCREVSIDVVERRRPKPSDHAPVIGTFAD